MNCHAAQHLLENQHELEAIIMKKWIAVLTTLVSLAILAGLAVHLNQSKVENDIALLASNDTLFMPEDESAVAVEELDIPKQTNQDMGRSITARQNSADSPSMPTNPQASPANAAADALFRQELELLISPQSTFAESQAVLERLRKSGKLDRAITDLEQRIANDPQSAQLPAALGRLYLQKCGTLQDVREQGILAMKADQVFDAALNLDASNWESRFTKAVAMSYWPTQLNKGTEVMQHFSTLVEQQEAQSPQPHFAQTYLWLGDEYQKYGYADRAREMWQRGLTLFPGDAMLPKRLVQPAR